MRWWVVQRLCLRQALTFNRIIQGNACAIDVRESLGYNACMKLWGSILVGVLAFSVVATARTKHSVALSLQMPATQVQSLPFTAHAPAQFRGALVRFIHPKTGQSAVARVVKRGGASFKTNAQLGQAIGVNATVATLFVEDVY